MNERGGQLRLRVKDMRIAFCSSLLKCHQLRFERKERKKLEGKCKYSSWYLERVVDDVY